jgi:3-hydroxyisobutyrate dehydrogenase
MDKETIQVETIGFIGLGNMGMGMAGNIQKADYPMVVFDIREAMTRPFVEQGAKLATSAADVARQCDVTFTSLPGPAEVEAVALGPAGVLEGIQPGAVYVDLSTSRPTLIRQIEPQFRAKGAHVLDAPISGGKTGAATRNLAVMVGGDKTIFDRIKPVLDAFGDKVFYAGDIGAGAVCKLVHNMISHGIRQAIAEGLTLGVKAGVDAETVWECVRRGSNGRMRYLHESIPRNIFNDDFDAPSFMLALARKDIALATELGREFNVPMPVANLAEQIAIDCLNRGWGEKDSSVTFKIQELAAGVEVRKPGVDPVKAGKFITTNPDIA